jgi:hypothetical protein
MVTTPQHRNQGTGRDYSAAMMLMLLLIVGAGVLTWYWVNDRDSKPARTESVPAPVAVPVPATSISDGAPARGGIAETWDAQHAGTTPQTVYVVESDDAADRMRSLLSMADEIVVPSGTAPPSYRVIVVEAGRDAAQMLNEEQQIRNVEGLPALEIVDLRPSQAVLPAGPDGSFPMGYYGPESVGP